MNNSLVSDMIRNLPMLLLLMMLSGGFYIAVVGSTKDEQNKNSLKNLQIEKTKLEIMILKKQCEVTK